ncbi:MAG: serine protease [Oligoflexia bacterium]|nr:serine protease [Oligoflexia bacterium]
MTSNHVIDQVLGPNDIFFGFQKNGRAQARFWFTTTVLHRFLGIDVATLKFDSCFSSLPLSPKGASQGDEIGVYGFPAASIQIDGNGSVQRDTAWPKVAKTVVGCAGVMTKTLGSVVLQDKELLEAQFMFVGGNSGGPIFCAKTGKVLGIVTGVQNLPQGAFQVNTQNLGNQVAIPLATYAVGISIKEVTQLLERAHYTHWW